MPFALSEDEKIRYRRQLIMSEIGVKGQMRIKQATVLIAGVGGLGGLSASYMAAAGVGKLKIVDMDRVAGHNLNRQILYTAADVGKRKAVCAQARLKALNPSCHIEVVNEAILPETIDDMTIGCDLIIDGTDTIETRHVLNRATFTRCIPFIFGGVRGFDGMVATFIPGQSACLACLFPENKRIAAMETETGIIGPTAGVIASLQCMEALKMLIGRKADLAGSLMHVHGLGMRIKKVTINRDPECLVCSMK